METKLKSKLYSNYFSFLYSQFPLSIIIKMETFILISINAGYKKKNCRFEEIIYYICVKIKC